MKKVLASLAALLLVETNPAKAIQIKNLYADLAEEEAEPEMMLAEEEAPPKMKWNPKYKHAEAQVDEDDVELAEEDGNPDLEAGFDIEEAQIDDEVELAQVEADDGPVGQTGCMDPVGNVELRNLGSKLCVDIAGAAGTGNAATWHCDGLADQQMVMCEDGSLRNLKGNFCLNESGGNVSSVYCNITSAKGVTAHQKFKVGRKYAFQDAGGIKQTSFEIVHVNSGKCLDIAGRSGHGNIGLYGCEYKSDQFFYFRSRGKMIASGQMSNRSNNKCLDVVDPMATQNAMVANCNGAIKQKWRYYENGEFLNDQSNICLDVSGSQAKMAYCTDSRTQMWDRQSWNGYADHFPFKNKHTNQCLNSNGHTAGCNSQPDQKFKAIGTGWKPTPTGRWVQVECMWSGPLTESVSKSYSSTDSLSGSLSATLSATVEASASASFFGTGGSVSASATASATASIAKGWSSTSTSGRTVSKTCAFNQDGSDWKGGCMYEFIVSAETHSGNKLKWNTGHTKCTQSGQEPKCLPYTKCADNKCTSCKEI